MSRLPDRLRSEDLPPQKITKKISRFNDNVQQGDFLFGLYKEHPAYQGKVDTPLLTMVKVNKDVNHELTLFTRSKEKKPNSKKRITYKKPYKNYIRSLTLPQQQQLLFMHAHRLYLFKARHRPLHSFESWVNHVFIHRMCKLSAVTGHLTGRRIHFILDGIDHERVVKKKIPGKAERDRSITSAELRALFRCRDALDMSKLFFYKAGMQVDPPWLDPVNKQWYDYYELRRRESLISKHKTPTLWQMIHAPLQRETKEKHMPLRQAEWRLTPPSF